MLYDRLDGTKTEINASPIGILRQAGLEITIEDHPDDPSQRVAFMDFSEVGGNITAGRYRESFFESMTEREILTSAQQGAELQVAFKKGGASDNIVAIPAAVLGRAIQLGDQLGQNADAIIETMSAPKASPVSVAGAGGFALIPEA